MTDFPMLREDSGRMRSEGPGSTLGINSHYSHRSPSVSQSVRSWVLSTQQNPPLPPPSVPEHVASPLYGPRPLPGQPHGQSVQSQGPLSHPPLQVTNPSETDDEYDTIDADEPGLATGYLTEGLGRGRRYMHHPRGLVNGATNETQNRSLVSGIVRGLKKLPKRVLRYRNSSEKRGPTSGTEEGGSTEAVTTLPRYRSNPSTPIVGPPVLPYPQITGMPMPEPQERLPADALRSVRPRHPSYRVMPPSTHGLVEEQSAQVYDAPLGDPPTFQASIRQSSPPLDPDRATTVIYDIPADATSTVGQPQSQSLRISYISHHTANTHVPSANPTTPQLLPPSDIQDNEKASNTPVLAHPPLSTDYRKMSLGGSHETTSHDTTSTSCSSEPSFSSELSPVKRFLHVIQSLPWVATERVTSDYHPGGGMGKDTPKSKPLISWYRRTQGDSRRSSTAAPVDLLSTGSRSSHGARPLSNAATITSVATPVPRVRRAHSHTHPHRHHHNHVHHRRNHHHHHQTQHHRRHQHGRHRHHHHHHHHNMNSILTGVDGDEYTHGTQNPSPVIPSVYPLPFPYGYHYSSYPPPQTSPRGPRTRHSPSFPGGYTPFQPMPPSPPPPPIHMPTPSPVYVLAANAQSQGSGFGDGQATGAMKQVMPMYVVPGNYNINGTALVPSPTSSPGPVQSLPVDAALKAP
ncbi:hypothetical protein AMATHDRAFT_54680 [Amanita thiersii Skay4041]|uniref:Uncharacterized protein n=1 Tax=Amanita thiersii Skay4041 TaxID=703135 RepID=A0A2A9NZQ1_9AGAR|nr:hypothetical protein AMATHDRAFT_54680 [Amanita thiersii Skay4041]